jgi:solute carrier family 35 protein E4
MSNWLKQLGDKRKRRSWSLDKTNAKIRRTLSDPLKCACDAFGFGVMEETEVIITAEKEWTGEGISRFVFRGKANEDDHDIIRRRSSHGRINRSASTSSSSEDCCGDSISKQEEACKVDYFTEFFKVPVAVAGWFILGISISNLNKYILTSFQFNFPIALTTIQMLTSFCLNHVLLTLTPLRRFNQQLPSNVIWQIYILSALFSGSIALGNIGLKYLYVSFAKMIMATSPAVTVVLAKCMTGIHLTQGTYTSLIPLCGGTILCAVGEVNFHWTGFAAMIGSTVLKAFRSLFEGIYSKNV